MPGPLPKRTSERRRRNKPPIAVESVAGGAVIVPPPVPPNLHPIAERWFESLRTSGQSQFYEPSDWAAAEYVATVMTKNLLSPQLSAVMFAAVWSAMTDLLTTEGARRKARIEVEREQATAEVPASVKAIADYRTRLAGS